MLGDLERAQRLIRDATGVLAAPAGRLPGLAATAALVVPTRRRASLSAYERLVVDARRVVQLRLSTREAAETEHADDSARGFELQKAAAAGTRSGPGERSAAASRVLTGARNVYRQHAVRLLQEAQSELEGFHGIPARFSLADVVAGGNPESVLQHTLAWMLDPNASHGCGDRFLRAFLSTIDLTLRGRVVTDPRPLEAAVYVERSIPIPALQAREQDELSDDDGRSALAEPRRGSPSRFDRHERRNGAIRLDIAVHIESTLVVIETKAMSSSASESMYDAWAWADIPQAAFYQAVLGLATAATKGLTDWEDLVHHVSIRTAPGDPLPLKELRDIWRSATAVMPSITKPADRVLSVLVDDGRSGDDVASSKALLHSRFIRQCSWLDVARLSGEIVNSGLASAEVGALIQGFRTSIYQNSRVLSAVEELRYRQRSPDFARRYARLSIQAVRRLRAELRPPMSQPQADGSKTGGDEP